MATYCDGNVWGFTHFLRYFLEGHKSQRLNTAMLQTYELLAFVKKEVIKDGILLRHQPFAFANFVRHFLEGCKRRQHINTAMFQTFELNVFVKRWRRIKMSIFLP